MTYDPQYEPEYPHCTCGCTESPELTICPRCGEPRADPLPNEEDF